MDFAHKKVLVIGLARSGISATRELVALGAEVTVNDQKNEEQLTDAIQQLADVKVQYALAQDSQTLLADKDIVLISPGVPIDSPVVIKAKEKGIEVIGELELAYRLCKAPIIAITGTNGKTTTTALTGEIFKAAGVQTYVVGNIGIPFIQYAREATAKDVMVVEVSSFQLESTRDFHPKVSAVLNITPDHLNRHHTFEQYMATKARIFECATQQDVVVLNADCKMSASMKEKTSAKAWLFSRLQEVPQGVFIKEGWIVSRENGVDMQICEVNELGIIGPHNVENALAATAIARAMGVSVDAMKKALKAFCGVEHRLQKIATINGISFFNDSKGTNPEASIKAIESMNQPTVLIAGGYDKGADFDEFVRALQPNIRAMVVIGQTADKLIEAAEKEGFSAVIRAVDMRSAVKMAYGMAQKGGNVLLSPACASFDMFEDYEHRGRVFCEMVEELRG